MTIPLRKSTTGSEVNKLQQLLNQRGYPVEVDGVFGNETYNAVRAFQSQNLDQLGQPLVIDGIVGLLTWWSLTHPKPDVITPSATDYSQMPPVGLGGSIIGRAALAAAIGKMNAGAGEIGGNNSRPRLNDLAQRIEPIGKWENLILPEQQIATLKELAMHVKQRARVYEEWGFGAKGILGLGITALFTGESGTGKTMASEVLANELNLDLYRIDLSQVVNKYIGETEKNLKKIFDAAEDGGCILFFDEADALFGKRTNVRDSHDRYANNEVSYLLQHMEAFPGLTILATNIKNSIDDAFIRRFRCVLHFPEKHSK